MKINLDTEQYKQLIKYLLYSLCDYLILIENEEFDALNSSLNELIYKRDSRVKLLQDLGINVGKRIKKLAPGLEKYLYHDPNPDAENWWDEDEQ